MSFLGGGGTGEIRYAVIVDDSQASGKLNNFMNSLNKMNAPTQQLNNNMNTLNKTVTTTTTDMSRLSTTFNAGVNKIQSAGPPLANLEKSVKSTGSSFQKFGNFAKENVANVAILASGIAMLDDSYLALHKAQVANDRAHLMVEKSEQQVAKTQEALNKLVRAGKTGTTEYALKSNDLRLAQEKLDVVQQRAEVSQENLNERTEDFWNSLIPNALIVGGSAFNMIKSLGITTENFSGAIGKLSGSLVTANGGLSSFGGLMAGGLGIAGAIILIKAVEGQVDKFYKTIQAKPRQNATIVDAIFDWKGFVQKSKEGTAEIDEILQRTGASLAEFALAPERVGQRFLEMGGKIDASGKIALTAKDHFFDLGLGINGIGKSSVQYIHWTQQMIEQQKGQGEIMLWLTKITGLDLPHAQQVYNLAVKDAAPGLAQMSKAMEDVGMNWIANKGQIDAYIVSMTKASDVQDTYLAGLHQTSAQTEAALVRRKEFTDSIQTENDNLIKTAKSYGANMQQLSGLNGLESEGATIIEDKNTKLKALIVTLKKQNEVYTVLREDLPDYNTNLHNSSMETANAVAKAKSYAGSITDFNAQLVKHAQGLNVDTNLINKNTAATTDGTQEIIKKNQNLKVLIHDSKGYTVTLDENTDATNKARQALEDWNKAVADAKGKISELQKGATISAALKIETNKEKLMKKLLNSLPDHIKKDIKAEIKFTGDKEAQRANFMELLQKGIDAGESDVDYDKIVKKIIDNIDKNFPNDPVMQNMKRELGNAIAGDKTEAQVQKMLQQWNLTVPITGEIDPNLVFPGGGFDFDINNPKTTKKKTSKKKNVSYSGLNMPPNAIGVDEFGNWVDRNGKVVGSYGANINIPGGTQPQGNYPGGAYGGSNQTMKPFPSSVSLFQDSKTGKTGMGSSLDVLARQIDQITKNLNTLARATVQVTTDNNQLARTITQITKDNNVLAKTTVQVQKDYDMEARAIAQTTVDNNILAKTIIQITKDNNILAKTTVQITKDYNTLAKVVVQNTKNNNVFAKTIVQVGKDFNSASDDAKSFAKALIAVASAASKARKAIQAAKGAGAGSNLQFGSAQEGMHQKLSTDMWILAHKGERVDIGQPTSDQNVRYGGEVGTNGTLIVNLTNVNSDRETIRTFRRELGKDIYRFGPT